MGFFNFPHTRTYDTDLGWLIKELNRVKELLSQYLENAVITFADPITWNITEQYPALTCVIDSDGTAYLSKQPVPAGVDISNTNYWLPIFNYDDNINQLRSQIAYNAQNSDTTGAALSAGDLVFWKGLIYEVITDMPAGTAFIIDSNIRKYTVDEKINSILGSIGAEESARIAADQQLANDIQAEATARSEADQTLTGNIQTLTDSLQAEEDARIAADTALSDRIDGLDFTGVYIVPEDYGAKGDGTTDDTAALQRCFDIGKPVYLRNNYVVSAPLRYTGHEIMGPGQLIAVDFPSDQPIMLDIQTESIRLEGIKLNANNAVCVGMRIDAERDVYIRGVEVLNTSTTYYQSNYGSGGIYVLKCSKAEISECYIHDVNRDKGVLRTHSSYGIVVNCRNTAYIHDNVIMRIQCSIYYTDCDGIYITYIDDTDKTTAVVENNKIFDCTGRFIKSQTTYTVARNNYCRLTINFTPNEGYFNCVSIQRGSFEIVNNYFNLGSSIDRGYTRCFTLEVYDTVPRTGIISGNVVEALTNGAYPQTIRNYFFVVSTVANNNIDVDISNNIFTGKTETAIALNSDDGVNGIIKFDHNKTNVYQAIECLGAYTNFDKILLDYTYNDNLLFNSTTRLSSETSTFTKLRYRFNLSMNETINNYPIDYTQLLIFEGYYRGNQQPMANVPAVIARGDYLFMIKSPTVTQYYNVANGKSGYII